MLDFVHPGEQSAWNKLTENKAFQYAVDIFHTVYTDLTAFAAMKGRNFLVTESTMPDIYHLYQTAARRIGIAVLPPLYIQMEYPVSIQTVGTDGDCAMLINSACLEECSEEQLLALFGQEFAHIRYRHLRILNMGAMLDALLTKLPMVGPVAAQALKTLLLQWKEYAYYTADRGAAIAAGGKLPVFQNLTQAMGMRLDENGVESLLSGGEKREALSMGQSAASKTVLQMMIGGIAVPFGMWRIRELHEWAAAPEAYQCTQGTTLQVEMDTMAQKTVDTVDWATKGIYHGAVKTVEAVKTGKEELDAYVEVNRPIWESNIAKAKEKTAEAIRTGQKEVTSYIKEKSPEWKENLASARESAAGALQTGTKEMAARLSDLRKKWEKDKKK